MTRDPLAKFRAELRPIDEDARNGGCFVVTDGNNFAVARWMADTWVYPQAHRQIDFQPTEYKP